MGLFGSTKTVYLGFTIYLSNVADWGFVNGSSSGTTVDVSSGESKYFGSPVAAAAAFSAPIQIVTQPISSPSTRSEWLVAADQTDTGNAATNYPSNVAQFVRKSGGWLGFGGTKTTFIWVGSFKFLPAATDTPGGPGVPSLPMQARRWIDGFEMFAIGTSGEGGTPNPDGRGARGASRHLSGYGLFLDNTTATKKHTPIENGQAVTTSMWERFYVRFRRFPTAASQVWRVQGATSANAGIIIEIGPTGQLAIYNVDAGGTKFLLTSTSAFTINVWYKIDLLYAFGVATTGGYFQLWQNSTKVVDLNGVGQPGNTGLGQLQNVATSTIGGGPAVTLSWNVDDWVAAPYTFVAGVPSGFYGSCDAITGSRVALVGPTSFAADNDASWAATGTWRTLRQRPVGNSSPQALTSSVSGAKLSVITDAALEVDDAPGANGYMGFIIGLYGLRAGALDGTLGYKLPGGADVMVGILQQNFQDYTIASPPPYFEALYAPAGLITPRGGSDAATRLGGLEIKHFKAANVSLATAVSLLAAVELQGVFGREDQTAAVITAGKDVMRTAIGIHNAPYPRSPWAMSGPPPESPVLIKSGTYVGNGTFQDLTFRSPPHMIWIRQVVAAGVGIQWWSSMNAAHKGGQAAYEPSAPVDVLTDGTFVAGSADSGSQVLPPTPTDAMEAVAIANQIAYGFVKHDPTAAYWYQVGHVYTDDPDYFFRRILGEGAGGADIPLHGPYAAPPSNFLSSQTQSWVVRIAGAAPAANKVGDTYQYVAYADPGMRFSNMGALGVKEGTLDFTTPLDSEVFTPDAVFLLQEVGAVDAVVRMFFKGPGHAATAIQNVGGGAEIASGLAMSLGNLTSKSALMFAGAHQIAFAAFRKNDSSGDPGVPVQIGSYVGDGSASRSQALTPASGKRPLFAFVQPAAAAAIFRDPSHTGTTSTSWPATDVPALGITGGDIDILKVGLSLNANAVVYNYFVIPGDSAGGGNGGFSPNGEFVPVETAAPQPGGAYDPTPVPAEPPVVPPDGGAGTPIPVPGGTPTPFGTQCAAASTVVINQALAKLGISKQIADIVTELSNEATVARLFYSDDVDATLRAHPWPFATKYVTLTLVAGTSTIPVNGDWQYSYRWPSDCLFARRIVKSTGLAGTTALVGSANRVSGTKRAHDLTPPDFRVGGDDTGPLIYCNEPLAELEYTRRPACAASQGDAIFRDALAWKHAHSLAAALSRDEKKVQFCWAMFLARLVTAATKASNEEQQDPNGDPDWIQGRQ